jgi:dihydroorotate dehydrogenase electron transfer subunit
MQKLRVNDEIPVTGPLGNGISELNCSSIGLLTRGVGAAAVVLLAEKAAVENISVYAFLSASTANRLVCREYVEKAATEFFIATDDGSEGYHGDARDMMKNFLSERTPDQVYTCGSKRFARYTQQLTDDGLTEGYLFLEEYMACGVGYCHGCAVRQRNSDKYFLVCEHGPVFRADEVEVE